MDVVLTRFSAVWPGFPVSFRLPNRNNNVALPKTFHPFCFISIHFDRYPAFKISYSTAATKTHYKRPIRSNCEPLEIPYIYTIWLILTNILSWWNAKRASVICKVRLKLKTIFSKCGGCHKFARMTHIHRPTTIQNRTRYTHIYITYLNI